MNRLHRFRPFLAVCFCLFFYSPVSAQKQLLPAVRALSKEAAQTLSNRWVGGVPGLGVRPAGVWKSPQSVRYPLPSVSSAFSAVPSVSSAVPIVPDLSRLVIAPPPRMPVFPGKKTVDAVIFDLDGTLLDSLSAWEHSGSNFLRTQGITPPEGLDEELVKLSLMDGARLVKERFNLPQTPEEILRLTLQPIRERYYRDLEPKPGVPELLRFLKAQGVKLCVATASDRELAQAALERTGLMELFDFIITCDEVGAGKRSPAVYEAALKRLGTDKARTLVAEDALYALQTAKKAGFLTAGISDAHAAADQPVLRRLADYYIPSFTACRIEGR